MEDYKLKYEHLCKMVLGMLDMQQLYFKTKDYQVLAKSKAMEKELREIITPKPVKQTSFFTEEFLGR